MERCLAVRNLMCNILSYLYIDDWHACHTLSSKTVTSVNKLHPFIEKWIGERLIQLLTTVFGWEGLVLAFFKFLSESHAFITGSIFLELLIGTTTPNKPFQAKDIDIFLPHKFKYTSLHRFLWLLATGTESIPGKKLTEEELMHAMTSVRHETLDAELLPTAKCDLLPQIQFYWQEESVHYILRDKMHIVQITEYYIGKLTPKKFQLVEVNGNDIENFIHTAFDFQCVMGFYDGSVNRLQLPNFADVLNRRLMISPVRQQYVGFMSPDATRHYKEKRIQKYKDRGFELGHDLSCLGKYWKRLDELQLTIGRSYTVPHLIRLCETGQRQAAFQKRYPPTKTLKASKKRRKK